MPDQDAIGNALFDLSGPLLKGFVQREPSTRKSQIEKIRDAIQESGECIVSREQLRMLCAEGESASGQWNAIAKIAIDESWSFTFFPDGRVRFAKL